MAMPDSETAMTPSLARPAKKFSWWLLSVVLVKGMRTTETMLPAQPSRMTKMTERFLRVGS